MTYDTTATAMLTIAQYSSATGLSLKTVNRYLGAGELPGAIKDDRGRWLIPSAAVRTTSTTDVVTLGSPRPPTYDTAALSHPIQMTLDRLPSFLTLDAAAQILGISRHAIATHREYFDVVPFGPNGSLVIPLATIKRIRG